MNVIATVFAPAIVFLKANAVILLLRWMPFIFFALTVGAGLAFDSPIDKLGIVLLLISTITLILDVEGKLPQIKTPPPA